MIVLLIFVAPCLLRFDCSNIEVSPSRLLGNTKRWNEAQIPYQREENTKRYQDLELDHQRIEFGLNFSQHRPSRYQKSQQCH